MRLSILHGRDVQIISEVREREARLVANLLRELVVLEVGNVQYNYNNLGMLHRHCYR